MIKAVLVALGILGITENASSFGFNQFQQGNNCGQLGNCGGGFPQQQFPQQQFPQNCGQQPCQPNPFLPQNPQYGVMYQASTTTTTPSPAATPCPTPAPAPPCIQTAADRICAIACNIDTYTVPATGFTCDGSGVGAVCCIQATAG